MGRLVTTTEQDIARMRHLRLDNMTYDDIAADIGLSSSTVRGYINDGRSMRRGPKPKWGKPYLAAMAYPNGKWRSFQAIGEALGVSRQRAHSLIHQHGVVIPPAPSGVRGNWNKS